MGIAYWGLFLGTLGLAAAMVPLDRSLASSSAVLLSWTVLLYPEEEAENATETGMPRKHEKKRSSWLRSIAIVLLVAVLLNALLFSKAPTSSPVGGSPDNGNGSQGSQGGTSGEEYQGRTDGQEHRQRHKHRHGHGLAKRPKMCQSLVVNVAAPPAVSAPAQQGGPPVRLLLAVPLVNAVLEYISRSSPGPRQELFASEFGITVAGPGASPQRKSPQRKMDGVRVDRAMWHALVCGSVFLYHALRAAQESPQ
jgi:hypothetical protein